MNQGSNQIKFEFYSHLKKYIPRNYITSSIQLHLVTVTKILTVLYLSLRTKKKSHNVQIEKILWYINVDSVSVNLQKWQSKYKHVFSKSLCVTESLRSGHFQKCLCTLRFLCICLSCGYYIIFSYLSHIQNIILSPWFKILFWAPYLFW